MDDSDRGLHVTVNGGNFTDVRGSYYHVQNINTHNEPGIFALSQAISTGAMYDSAALYPLGKCHPGTRETIIKTILDWVTDPASSTDVLWLCGPAGSGKSAIMHTIAEKLHELHKEHYGGSFFFARGVPGRDQATVLFATLAYQLAMNFPSLRSPINHAMAADPTLPSKSMEVQLKLLLVEPLTSCSDMPSSPPTMIIDGLDECGNSRTQRQILTTIANAIAVAHVPLRFLVASRPEYWIRDPFDHLPLLNITQQLNLSDSDHASDSFEDIRKYLREGFDDIYEKNQDIMCHAERPWPSEDLVREFAYRASGQFIFASVVLKFVDDESDDFSNPQDKLRILTNPGPLQASAFSELDQLYMRILSGYRKPDTLIQVLGGLLECPHPKFVGVSLGIDSADLNLALRAISSLIRTADRVVISDGEALDLLYGPPKGKIEFCHLSFREFLEDKARSGPFWIDIEAVENNLFLYLQDMFIGSLNGTWINHDFLEYVLKIGYSIGAPSGKYNSFNIQNLALAVQMVDTNEMLMSTTLLLQLLRHLEGELTFRNEKYFQKGYNEDRLEIENIIASSKLLKDECIRKILSETHHAFIENAVFFSPSAKFYGGRQSTYGLAMLPGFSKERIKTCLIHSSPLIIKDIWDSSSYILGEDVHGFLCAESRGGRFHFEYRSHFVRTSRSLLAFLLDTCENEELNSDATSTQRGHLDSILQTFLATKSVLDLRFDEDPGDAENFDAFIKKLCAGNNYKKLESPGGRLNIIRWLHRQLNQRPQPHFLDDNILQQSMLNTVEQICNTVILPFLLIPFYSDDNKEEQNWLSSLKFPPCLVKSLPATEPHLSPYNIRPLTEIVDHTDRYSVPSQVIKMILWEDAKVYPPIDRELFSTSLLETYLLVYVSSLHHIGTGGGWDLPQGSWVPWFAYAFPTKKIQAALWTLHNLCSVQGKLWRPPPGFCSEVIDFLEKHGLDKDGDLTRWLEDLIPLQLRDDSSDRDWFGTPYWLVPPKGRQDPMSLI